MAAVTSRKNDPYALSRLEQHWSGRFVAMACPCEVLIEPVDESVARSIVTEATACAWRVERKFSRYRADSVVQRINTANGTTLEVDTETADLLDFAATLTSLSEGRFDITSGVLRKAWTFDGSDRVPTQAQIDALLANVGWHKVVWQRPALRMPAGMELDLGGIGKEYAVDLAADAAQRVAPGVSCLINFGGDIVVRHERRDGMPWRIGVETVQRAGSAAGIVNLQRGGLATSGDTRRYILRDGRRYSHILDARTGWPVQDAPHSITVAADTCSQAGALATLAMLQGANARGFLESSGVQYWLQ